MASLRRGIAGAPLKIGVAAADVYRQTAIRARGTARQGTTHTADHRRRTADRIIGNYERTPEGRAIGDGDGVQPLGQVVDGVHRPGFHAAARGPGPSVGEGSLAALQLQRNAARAAVAIAHRGNHPVEAVDDRRAVEHEIGRGRTAAGSRNGHAVGLRAARRAGREHRNGRRLRPRGPLVGIATATRGVGDGEHLRHLATGGIHAYDLRSGRV